VEEPKPLIREHRLFMRKYPNCLTGAELMNWLVVNNRAADIDGARRLATQLMAQTGLTAFDTDTRGFEAGTSSLYHFEPIESRSAAKAQARGVARRGRVTADVDVSTNSMSVTGEQSLAKRDGTMFVSLLEEQDSEAESSEVTQKQGEERECTVHIVSHYLSFASMSVLVALTSAHRPSQVRLSEGILSFSGVDGFSGEIVLSPTVSVSKHNTLLLAMTIGNHSTHTSYVFRCRSQVEWSEWMAAILDTKMSMMLMEDGAMNV
jgi:hypothetical protein